MRFSSRIEKITKKSLPLHWINRWLKKEIKYLYKRGNSRPALSIDPKLKYMQWIFGCRVLDMIAERKVIFNIDEATYSRSIKCNYSWLPRGKSCAVIITKWIGKTNVVFGLATDGNWIAIISDLSTISIRFSRYLLLLQHFSNLWMAVRTEDLRITLDNALVHVSAQTKKAAEWLGTRLILLPPYSPSLAPTEWVFGSTKKSLASQRKIKCVNFSKHYGKMMIVKCLKNIRKDIVVRICQKFIQNVEYMFNDIKVLRLINGDEPEVQDEEKSLN